MINVRPQDALHKAMLLRLLVNIIDNPVLSKYMRFKGGTCAAMLGLLDRFSVDLDFDLAPESDENILRKQLELVFSQTGLAIKDQSKNAIEYFLKYEALANQRNTLKLDALNFKYLNCTYQPRYLAEIDRTIMCQTAECIFANKLVAPLDRFARNKTVAGRDIYDINYFFLRGMKFNEKLIEERAGKSLGSFMADLYKFIDERITSAIIDQDLNTLLTYDKFKQIRKTLKNETLQFVKQYISL